MGVFSVTAQVLSSAFLKWFPATDKWLTPVWLGFCVLKTGYCYYWDLVHDWKLKLPFAGEGGPTLLLYSAACGSL
jgi:hypothetical protein